MYMACFGCESEYRIWKSPFENAGVDMELVIQNDMENEVRMHQVREQIYSRIPKEKVLILFQMNSMDLNTETFFKTLSDKVMIVPVGSSAILLGCASAEEEHVQEINRYLIYGGEENVKHAGEYILKNLLDQGIDEGIDKGIEMEIDQGIDKNMKKEIPPPVEKPFDGIFSFGKDQVYGSLAEYLEDTTESFQYYVGILVHRDSWMKKDYECVRILEEELKRKGIGSIPVFSNSNSNCLEFDEIVRQYFSVNGMLKIKCLINEQMFLIRAKEERSVAEQSVFEFEKMDIPVLHPVQSFYLTKKQWQEKLIPFSADMPNALITPEMAGMTESLLIGVKNEADPSTEAITERIQYLAGRVAGKLSLAGKQNKDKKLVIMLHNSVCSGVEATIGKTYGLNTFESVIRLMDAFKERGYDTGDYPATGEELHRMLMEKKAFSDFRWTSVEDIMEAGGCIYEMDTEEEYQVFYQELPPRLRNEMEKSWGPPPGEGMVISRKLIITGLIFGNITVMVQPKRGCYGAKCTGEVCKILHDPACPPPHQYLAVYRYMERIQKADACIDIGSEGSLEFLPGKTNGLSENCWPGVVLGSMPGFYLYNAGVVGEALMAKRRIQDVIIDFLPSVSRGIDERASLLIRSIEAYFQAVELENGQAGQIRQEIENLLKNSAAAGRIVSRADSFEQGLRDVAGSAAIASQARKISTRHVIGNAPGEEETAQYIQEVRESDAAGGIHLTAEETALDEAFIRENLKRCDDEIKNLLHALEGGYVPAGESGMPDENGRRILPTGRNMFGQNTDKVPTRTAYDRGKELAVQLLDKYRQEEGKIPEKIAMNMISLDITRSNGEQLSEFLYLLGICPRWDWKERVTGLDVIPTESLGRPRIDVTVRISGVLRDTWPQAAKMMDEAVLLVSSLDETEEENYIIKHMTEYLNSCSVEEETNVRKASIRIFGDAPGTYGAGIDLALKASAWKEEEDLAKYFIQTSAFAYGKDLEGKKSVREFIENIKNVDLSSDTTASRRMDSLSCGFSTEVQGGIRLVAKYLGKKDIRQYQSSSEKGEEIHTESLSESIEAAIRETLLNEFWKESIQDQEYDGASDIMHRIQNVFSAQCVCENLTDEILDEITESYVNDVEMREWLGRHNPYAMEEIARRMLELYTRGKYHPNEKVLERLKENYLIIEGDMEEGLETAGDIQGGNVEIINHEEIENWRDSLKDISNYF